jgi:hypothetical protein
LRTHSNESLRDRVRPWTRASIAAALASSGCLVGEDAAIHHRPASTAATTDVLAEIPGICPAAAGTGGTDDSAAIQCHLDYVYAQFGEGTVVVPQGSYALDQGLLVRGGVALAGAGQSASILWVRDDTDVVVFDAGTCGAGAALTNLTVLGYQAGHSDHNAVTVGEGCPVDLSNDTIWFGNGGLYDKGVGGVIENSFISGYQYAVVSQGANWYIRDKLDTSGLGSETAFYQGLPVPSAVGGRNYFSESDFSGDYQYSVQIQDATNTAITIFDGAVLSSPVLVNGARWTAFLGDEIGSPTFVVNANAGDVVVAASYAFGGTHVDGGGTNVYDGGGNTNLSFNGGSCASNAYCSTECGWGVDECGNPCSDLSRCGSGAYAALAPSTLPVICSSGAPCRGALDVTTEIPGSCPRAAGDGSADDAGAIQCHLDYLYNTLGAGVLYFPAGRYLVSGQLTVRGGVALVGAGPSASAIAVTGDASVIYFDAQTCMRGAALSDLGVDGYQDASAAQNTVTVGDNCPVNLTNDVIRFGNAALYDKGIDGMISDCAISGYQYAVISQGANWYLRDRLDTIGFASGTAFYQGLPIPGATSEENHFDGCSLSGDYQASIQIQDATSNAITVFRSCALSSPVVVGGSRWAGLVGDQLGTGVASSNAGVVTTWGQH